MTSPPPHHEASGGACVSWANALQIMTLTKSTTYTCMSITRNTDRTYFRHWRQQCHSSFQSTLSRHQNSHAWQYHGVSGILAGGTRDLSPAASRWFPMVLGDTAGATYSWMLFRWPTANTMCRSWCVSVLCIRPESGLWVWKCFTDYCWKQQHTTDILCPTCAAIYLYVNPASCRPTMQPRSNGLSCSTGVCSCRQGTVVS